MQTLFGKYVQKHPPQTTEAYELKIVKGKSIAFDRVAPHQVDALLKAEGTGLYHKLTDQPWMENRAYTYTLKKPFDCFVLVQVKSYVVLWFFKPRQPKVFYKIPIKVWVELQNTSKKKSINEQEVVAVAQQITL